MHHLLTTGSKFGNQIESEVFSFQLFGLKCQKTVKIVDQCPRRCPQMSKYIHFIIIEEERNQNIYIYILIYFAAFVCFPACFDCLIRSTCPSLPSQCIQSVCFPCFRCQLLCVPCLICSCPAGCSFSFCVEKTKHLKKSIQLQEVLQCLPTRPQQKTVGSLLCLQLQSSPTGRVHLKRKNKTSVLSHIMHSQQNKSSVIDGIRLKV